jgi:hypothetical protein
VYGKRQIIRNFDWEILLKKDNLGNVTVDKRIITYYTFARSSQDPMVTFCNDCRGLSCNITENFSICEILGSQGREFEDRLSFRVLHRVVS